MVLLNISLKDDLKKPKRRPVCDSSFFILFISNQKNPILYGICLFNNWQEYCYKASKKLQGFAAAILDGSSLQKKQTLN